MVILQFKRKIIEIKTEIKMFKMVKIKIVKKVIIKITKMVKIKIVETNIKENNNNIDKTNNSIMDKINNKKDNSTIDKTNNNKTLDNNPQIPKPSNQTGSPQQILVIRKMNINHRQLMYTIHRMKMENIDQFHTHSKI